MSAEAIVMMVVAMVILWGGLFLAIANLTRGDAASSADQPSTPTHRDP